MIYRDFGKTGLRVSAIGMGCEYVWTADEKQIFDLVRAAVDAGINYFDLFVGTPTTRECSTAISGNAGISGSR